MVRLWKKGPLSYLVKVSDGVVWRRHIDHLKILQSEGQQNRDRYEDVEPDLLVPDEGDSFPYHSSPQGAPENPGVPEEPPAPGHQPPAPPSPPSPSPRQYPQRSRTLPNWYGTVVTH